MGGGHAQIKRPSGRYQSIIARYPMSGMRAATLGDVSQPFSATTIRTALAREKIVALNQRWVFASQAALQVEKHGSRGPTLTSLLPTADGQMARAQRKLHATGKWEQFSRLANAHELALRNERRPTAERAARGLRAGTLRLLGQEPVQRVAGLFCDAIDLLNADVAANPHTSEERPLQRIGWIMRRAPGLIDAHCRLADCYCDAAFSMDTTERGHAGLLGLAAASYRNALSVLTGTVELIPALPSVGITPGNELRGVPQDLYSALRERRDRLYGTMDAFESHRLSLAGETDRMRGVITPLLRSATATSADVFLDYSVSRTISAWESMALAK